MLLWLLLPLLVKAQNNDPDKTELSDLSSTKVSCNYMMHSGLPYATDRCNAVVFRSGYYNLEDSYIFRCAEDNSYVISEWYENWNCSGKPYRQDYNFSFNGNLNCNGSTSCYMSVTNYQLYDECDEETLTGTYSYTVYSQDMCIYDDRYQAATTITCEDQMATVTYTSELCDNPYYSWYWYAGCIESNPYNHYVINCNAENEEPPLVISSITNNRNDANSCAYALWNGSPVAPNICFYYSWYNAGGYSFMLKCDSDNNGVTELTWNNTDCTGDPVFGYKSEYEFNCIGKTDCHANVTYYSNANISDKTCSKSNYDFYMVYAVDICIEDYYGYARNYECRDGDKLLYYSRYDFDDVGCSRNEATLIMRDGCQPKYNHSDPNFYYHYDISCHPNPTTTTTTAKAYETTRSTGNDHGSSNSDSSVSKGTVAAIVGSTLALLVLIAIAIAAITYCTKTSQFSRVKIDRTGMLTDISGTHQDEIFNDDGRGIRNMDTSDFATTNTTVVSTNDALPTTTVNTSSAPVGEYSTTTTMNFVGMPSEDERPN